MIVLQGDKRVKAERQVLIKNLLCMTSGIVYPDVDEAGACMQRLFDDVQVRLDEGEQISTKPPYKGAAGLC